MLSLPIAILDKIVSMIGIDKDAPVRYVRVYCDEEGWYLDSIRRLGALAGDSNNRKFASCGFSPSSQIFDGAKITLNIFIAYEDILKKFMSTYRTILYDGRTFSLSGLT